MSQTSETPDANKALFLQFVLMLSSSVMQQLGKLMNPLTGKAETNLEAAQATIDLLVMLDAKTRGNLDREEERFLKNTLATLQMNYVETAQSAPAQPEAPAPAPEPATPADAHAGEPAAESKEPKFHKSYT